MKPIQTLAKCHGVTSATWLQNKRWLTITVSSYIIGTNLDKSYDKEEYLGTRKRREKMVGANLREGFKEVAFEL